MNIYICKETHEPKGICYSSDCTHKSLSVKTETLKEHVSVYLSGSIKLDADYISAVRTVIDAYISNGSPEQVQADVFILPSGSSPSCMISTPPCSTNYSAEAKWYREGDYIYAKLPLVKHSALQLFRTIYDSERTSYTTPKNIGEADGSLTLTFDDGGFTYHKTALNDTLLTPGNQVHVSYKMRGLPDYQHLSFIDFQTNIFTSGTFLGCGLVKKQKKYNNPLKPDEGYTYEYIPYAGGEGETFLDEWSMSTDYRILVGYRGNSYWLKTFDFSPYSIGDNVFIMKKASSLPLIPDPLITNSCTKDELSENSDYVVQELFYA